MPLLVLETSDEVADGAYIGLPWTILTVAALALPMVSRALLAELSHPDVDAQALMRRANRLVLLVMTPATVLAATLVRPVLSLAGHGYADRGSLVLATGIMGLAPAALVDSQLALLRYHNRMVRSGVYQAARALALLGSVVALLALHRVEDIGFAFLAVNVVAAAGAFPLVRGAARPVGVSWWSRRRARRAAPSAGVPWWSLVPGTIGVVLALVAMAGTDIDDIGPYGLIQAVGPLHVVGAGLVALGAVCVLGPSRWARRWGYAHVGALIVLLHGLPGLVEPHPRFGVAWLHAGFVRHIAVDGTLLPGVDARFGWPGFFAGNALIQRLSGTSDVLWMVRFAPVVLAVFACTCIHLIGRALGLAPQLRILAMAVYLVSNWTGQDYFAPQATGFSLYLAVLAVLLTRFRSPATNDPTRLSRLLRPVAATIEPASVISGRARVAMLTGCATVCGVLVLTHQLTPGFLAAVLLLLAVTDVIRVRALPWVVGVATVTWLSYGAETYWRGHLDKLTRGIADPAVLVGDNISSRASGSVASRQLILGCRIGIALLIWLGVTIVLIHAWRRRRTPLALACMFAGPFPLFLLQPYGGEMLIRVFYFTLPAAALILAGALGASRLDSPRSASLRRRGAGGGGASVPAGAVRQRGVRGRAQRGHRSDGARRPHGARWLMGVRGQPPDASRHRSGRRGAVSIAGGRRSRQRRRRARRLPHRAHLRVADPEPTGVLETDAWVPRRLDQLVGTGTARHGSIHRARPRRLGMAAAIRPHARRSAVVMYAITDARFDHVSDLVGIPLAVVALLLLVTFDLRREAGRPPRRSFLVLTAFVGVLAVGVMVLRAIRLAP